MGFEDGLELAGVAFGEEAEGGNPVEEDAECQNTTQTVGRQVLVEHRQVVAEVELRLERRAFWQRAAADMVDDRVGAVDDLVAAVLAAPAEVDLFHVGEEVVIEATHLAPHFRFDEHCCT